MTHTLSFYSIETQKIRKIFLRHSNYNANASLSSSPPYLNLSGSRNLPCIYKYIRFRLKKVANSPMFFQVYPPAMPL